MVSVKRTSESISFVYIWGETHKAQKIQCANQKPFTKMPLLWDWSGQKGYQTKLKYCMV